MVRVWQLYHPQSPHNLLVGYTTSQENRSLLCRLCRKCCKYKNGAFSLMVWLGIDDYGLDVWNYIPYQPGIALTGLREDEVE